MGTWQRRERTDNRTAFDFSAPIILSPSLFLDCVKPFISMPFNSHFINSIPRIIHDHLSSAIEYKSKTTSQSVVRTKGDGVPFHRFLKFSRKSTNIENENFNFRVPVCDWIRFVAFDLVFMIKHFKWNVSNVQSS